jgi:hypothetical protein
MPELGGKPVGGYELEAKHRIAMVKLSNQPVRSYELDASMPRIVAKNAHPIELDATTSVESLMTRREPPASEWTPRPPPPPHGPQEQNIPMVTTAEPSAEELVQLLREAEELESRKQTLLELKNVQDEQVVLRGRIKALRHY